MDLVSLMNLTFCLVILALGIKRYKDSGVRAFIFVGLGFTMFGISHLSLLMGWGAYKTALLAVRSVGYVLVIGGLLL